MSHYRNFTYILYLISILATSFIYSAGSKAYSQFHDDLNREAILFLFKGSKFKDCNIISGISQQSCEDTKQLMVLMGDRLWRAKNFVGWGAYAPKHVPGSAAKLTFSGFAFEELNGFFSGDGLKFLTCLQRECATVLEPIDDRARGQTYETWLEAIVWFSCVYNVTLSTNTTGNPKYLDSYSVYYRIIDDIKLRKFTDKFYTSCGYPELSEDVKKFSLWRPSSSPPFSIINKF